MQKQHRYGSLKTFPDGFWLVQANGHEWIEDKAPQLGAALAYYTVFSLAPLILILLALVGVIFRHDPAGAWSKVTEQMGYFLDQSAVQVVQDIAQHASQPGKSAVASIIGVALALFGASGVFGQLQDALNTIWGLKAKPSAGLWEFLRARFVSFAMVAGVCFLLLVSLAIDAVLQALLKSLPMSGSGPIALGIYLVFNFLVVAFLFALIFKLVPDAKIQWRDVWVGGADRSVLLNRKMGARDLSRQRCGRFRVRRGQFAHHLALVDLLLGANPSLRGGIYPGLFRPIWLTGEAEYVRGARAAIANLP